MFDIIITFLIFYCLFKVFLLEMDYKNIENAQKRLTKIITRNGIH